MYTLIYGIYAFLYAPCERLELKFVLPTLIVAIVNCTDGQPEIKLLN